MKQMLADENLDAVALRCWPELPNLTGQWPYLAMVRLTDEGHAVTMEGDVDGAIGMLVLRTLGVETGFLTDWLEHDDHHITTWHGGGTPACLAAPVGDPNGRTIARHFNSNKPAVVDGAIVPDLPVTIMRLWPGPDGYRLMAREATTAAPTRRLRGTNGRIVLPNENVHDLFDRMCHAGMPHHLTVAPGSHRRILERVARLLGMTAV
jgi:L-fucose isomerase-like protein